MSQPPDGRADGIVLQVKAPPCATSPGATSSPGGTEAAVEVLVVDGDFGRARSRAIPDFPQAIES